MDLYQQLRKTDSPNQFFSPYSIHAALSMAMAGNEGEAISLVAPEERPLLAAVEKLLARRLKQQVVAGFERTPH